jgi:hypothetical protein
MDTWQDVLDWSEAAGEITYKERLEAQKLPKRLDPGNNDPADHPIDEGHFEAVIAPSCNGAFIGAKNPTQARKEANSRLRSVLRKYRAAHPAVEAAPVADALPHWQRLEAFVEQNEGFVGKGALFAQGRSKNFRGLKARFRTVAPARLDAPVVLSVLTAMPSGRRKSLGTGLRLLNLMRSMAGLPDEIRDLLPPSDLPTALGTGTSPRLGRDTVPASFWASLETAIGAALEPPEIAIDEALARIEAGEDAVAVRDAVNAARSRDVTNTTIAGDGYRQAVHWIVRGWRDGGGDLSLVTDVGQIMARLFVEAAIKAHDARARCGGGCRPVKETQTAANHLANLKTLARYGLRDEGLFAVLQLVGRKHRKVVFNGSVKGMSEDAERLVGLLHRDDGRLIRRIVEAPELVWEEVDKRDEGWKRLNRSQRLSLCKLAASASMWALQLSRPRRRANVMFDRLRPVLDSGARRPKHAKTVFEESNLVRVRTPAAEIKNRPDTDVEFEVRGSDAEILRRWRDVWRPRVMDLREIGKENVYLFPGAAMPKRLPDDIHLPHGCVSDAWFDECWDLGAEIVGVEMTPHQARHAIGVIWLIAHPGNYGPVAELLEDSEEIVRKKYARSKGAEVAADIRAHVLNRY